MIKMKKSNKKKKSKKGVSIMIGYVLLVSFVVILSALVYQWMKTYIPKDPLECPGDVSVFVEDISCVNLKLNLTLKNNGKFNIGGYFVRATDNQTQELATLNIAMNISSGGIFFNPGVKFTGGEENPLKPNNKIKNTFNLSRQIYSVEIIPLRIQVNENKKRVVSCGDSKIKEKINCV